MVEKTLIIGMGEVGKALYEVLKDYYEVETLDKNSKKVGRFNILHICFPYSKEFISQVKKYQRQYRPKYTIIHSTVPVGTSGKCGAIHSPIIGQHPDLAKCLKVFVKYLAGEKASEVADYFRKAGIKIYLFDRPEASELYKLLETNFGFLEAEYTKEVKRQCDKYKVPFEGWTIYLQNENDGYQKYGYPEYVRAILTPIMTKVGGHCLTPNLDLIDTSFNHFLKKINDIRC